MTGQIVFYHLTRVFCGQALGLLLRARALGNHNVPRTGSLIIAANHQSFLDPIMAGALTTRKLNFMARDTLFRHEPLATVLRLLNSFPVKRGRADIGAFKQSLRLLRQGGAVLLFPEGTRSAGGRIQLMQPGVIGLARKTRSPIVLVASDGTCEAWPRGARIPRLAHIWMEYGLPIDPATFDGKDNTQGAELLTDMMRDLHNRLRMRAGRKPFEYATPQRRAQTKLRPRLTQEEEKPMAEPIGRKKPLVIDETAGKKAYCMCGLSAKLPHCDGAHAREGTGITPLVCEITENQKVAICQCGASAKLPFCDGAHAGL